MKRFACFLAVILAATVAFGEGIKIKAGTLPAVKTDPASIAIPEAKAKAPEAAPTPMPEVVRVLGLLPKPEVAFVDFGCGADARWLIAAVEEWGCKAVGIEIDPTRAAIAKRRVEEAGLSNLITIIEGDSTSVDVEADVGVAYLYPNTLEKLKPRLAKLNAFASYIHEPPGLGAVKNGKSWIYSKPKAAAPAAPAQPRGAVWGGQVYSGRVCNNPFCGMCNSIQAQINSQATQAAAPATQAKGHYETRRFKLCDGRNCWFEDRQVFVPDP